MKSKITPATVLRKFTALLLSSAVLCSSYVQTIACASGWDDDYHYSLIPAEEASWDPYAPYFISGYTIYGRTDDPDINLPGNLEAWEKYFKLNDRDAISELIFKSDEPNLLQLVTAIKNKAELPAVWRDNALARQLAKNPKAPVLDYLSFSKRVEKHATQNTNWWDEPLPKDSLGMTALLLEGEKLLKKTKDKEIKMRYAFQLLRLRFYMGDYQGVNAWFTKSFAENEWNNKLKYQALNYDFGASWRLAQGKEQVSPEEKAALILKLSKTFQKCEDCPLLFFEDLHYFDAGDYFAAANVLSVKQDQIDLWMLASIRSVPLYVAMDKILDIDPNAPELRSLLDQMLENSQSERFKRSEPTTTDYFATEEWNQTQLVLRKGTLKKEATDRAQYAFMMAYYSYIGGKYKKAREDLANSTLLPGADNSQMRYQQRILKSLLDLETWNSRNLNRPHLLIGQLNEVLDINHPDLNEYTFRRLEELADKNGQMPLERVLFASMYRSVEGDLSYPEIVMLEKSYHNKEKSLIERLIWKKEPISLSQIGEWKGDALLAMHRFEEAAIAYKGIGRSQFLITDPFLIHVVDCHDCDHRDVLGTLSRLQFAEKMHALNSKAQNGDAQAALEYANGLYNITWFGNSRDAINSSLQEAEELEVSTFYSMDAPYAAYERALKLAPGKEKKAFVLFMLAKCEQNRFEMKENEISYTAYYGDDLPCDPVKNQEFRKNFALLKSSYANTEFYKLVLKECSYFEHYVRVH